MGLYKTEFIYSYIDLNKFIGFRGILLYTKMQHDFEFILNEIKNQDFIYSPLSVLEIINKIQDPEIKTFMQTTWDNYHGANKIS